MLNIRFKKLFFLYILVKLFDFSIVARKFEENSIVKFIKNSKTKIGNEKKKDKNISKIKGKGCCKSSVEDKKKDEKNQETTEEVKRIYSKIIKNVFKILGGDYEIKKKKDIFDEKYNIDESKKNDLDLNISEFIENGKKNIKTDKKNNTCNEPQNNIDFYNNVYFLKYLSEFITVSINTIKDLFINEIEELFIMQRREINDNTLISYSDFEEIIKNFKEKHFDVQGIKSIFESSLKKLKKNNPIRSVFLDKKEKEKENDNLLTDVLNFLSEFNIFDKIKEIKIDEIKFENIILTILKHILKNSDKQFFSLKKMNNDEFDKAIEKFSKHLEFNVEIKLNNYNDFINKTNENKGFTIEDYILIFKFVDFCSGNLDTFSKSSSLYNIKINTLLFNKEIKNNELLNLAGIEVIENLEKNGIIAYKKIEENDGKLKKYIINDKEKFRKNFKITFNDLKYIFNLIKSIDIYMYFDNTNKEDIYKRYNKSQIIYDVYNKSDNIVNNIKFFKEKLKKKDSNNNNLFVNKINKIFTYLYSKSETGNEKEVIKANGIINTILKFINPFNKEDAIDYNKICSEISKLNIVSNKDYFGIYCDKNTIDEK